MPEVAVVVLVVLGRWRKSFCEGESDGVCGAAPVFLALNCDFARKLGLFGCDAHENHKMVARHYRSRVSPAASWTKVYCPSAVAPANASILRGKLSHKIEEKKGLSDKEKQNLFNAAFKA